MYFPWFVSGMGPVTRKDSRETCCAFKQVSHNCPVAIFPLFFFLISFHPMHIFLLLSSAMGVPNPKSSFQIIFFGLMSGPD